MAIRWSGNHVIAGDIIANFYELLYYSMDKESVAAKASIGDPKKVSYGFSSCTPALHDYRLYVYSKNKKVKSYCKHNNSTMLSLHSPTQLVKIKSKRLLPLSVVVSR